MVLGTGIDLVDVPRLERFRLRFGRRGLDRLFTPGELDYCLGLADPDPSLAARFAAKEAFFKALGLGAGRGGRWVEVEVLRCADGRPSLLLRGRAREAAREAGVRGVHVSLTHTRQFAAAHVVVDG